MFLALGIHHMGGYGLDVGKGATLCASDVAVAHQRDVLTGNADDAVDNVPTVLNPRQHHVAHTGRHGLLQDDTLTTTDDERQHAASVDGERHADTIVDQSDGLGYDEIVVWHTIAASSLGRHTRCHMGTVDASSFSV